MRSWMQERHRTFVATLALLVTIGFNARGIAQCDSWQPLGKGMDDWVLAMTTHNNTLIAGGFFFNAGGQPASKVARWDGGNWEAIGSGFDMGEVRALTVHEGDIIAGGFFQSPQARIARWNGSAWVDMGGGLNGIVRTLGVYNGQLIAGGNFTEGNIAVWNGSTWSALGGGADGDVRGLTVYNNDLIAGGSFTQIGGQATAFIARWNGSWWAPIPSGLSSEVRAVWVFDGELIAGGTFDGFIARRRDCVGACCVGTKCVEVAASNCTALGGVFSPGVTCAQAGCSPPEPCVADIAPPGGDGIVNVNDLLKVINSWGPCP